MKKTSINCKLLRITAIVALFITGGVFQVHALDEVLMGEFEFGEEYTTQKNTVTKGFITVPKSGELIMSFKPGAYAQCVYIDEACQGRLPGTFNNNQNAPAYSYPVEAGETYYISLTTTQYDTPRTFSFYMDGVAAKPFEVAYYAPQTDGQTVYNIGYYEEMFVRYSKTVAAGPEAKLTYTDKRGSTISVDLSDKTRILGDYLYVEVGTTLINLLQTEGAAGISPNDPITISLKAKDSLGQYAVGSDEEGWLSYSYLCGYVPTKVVEETLPEAFLSYWVPGDPSGIISVTYSQPLSTTTQPVVQLFIGDIEGNEGTDKWYGTAPVKVDGNTVTVDLTGVRRSYNDILNGNDLYTNMNLTISQLYDVNGQPVVSNYTGNIAKYTANLRFVNLDKTGVYSDWVPANGSNLQNATNIEVWISGLNTVSFSGFAVESTTGTQTTITEIAMADIKKSEESLDGNEAVFTFGVPEVAKTADAVYVYPIGLVSNNGYEYDVYLRATYNCFSLIAVTPAQGADIDNLEGQTISAIFNYASDYPEMFVTVYVKDDDADNEDEEIVMAESPMLKDSYGTYNYTVTEKTKLYLNHTYEGVFTAWATEADYASGKSPIGTTSAIWYGTTPQYVNGVAVLESISPEEGTDLRYSDGIFVLTFDSQVRIDMANSYIIPYLDEPQLYSGVRELGEDFATGDDGYVYSTEWELTVPMQYIGASYPELTLVVTVIDADGRIVAGNKGKGEDSYFEFQYFNTSEVNQIGTNEETGYEVYTLTGIRVMKTDDVKALRELAPGIYIINGKKVKI